MVAKIKNGQDSLSSFSVGGKAFNLIKLKNANFSVPEFGIIPIFKIEKFLNSLNINKKYLSDIFNDNNKNALKKLEKIREKILKSNLTSELINEVEKLKQGLKIDKLIIRSSASSEDSIKDSFAGIYDSYILTKDKNNLIKKISKTISSLFSRRAYFYLKTRNIKEFPLSSIIIQEFIEGEISGVMFTTAIKEGRKGILINFNKGTALSVVEGKSGKEIFLEKGNKNIKNFSLLNNFYINKLIIEGKKIEKLFNSPQDVEWTIKDSRLYILQSRPITATISKEVRVWDNSNIAESYGGIVLPLTASYARHIYEATYIDLARRSGLSDRKIKQHKDIFENLLGFFYGRFYYNMLNWYRMMTLFPGYERNKSNLNIMISAKSKAELDEDYKKNATLYFKAKYYLILVLRYPFFENNIEKFKEHVKKYYREFSKHNFSFMSSRELLNLYYKSLRELLDKWSITVENDFLLMTFFGSLQKFAKRNRISEEEILNLVSNIKNVISAEQVNILQALSKDFERHNDLVILAKNKKYNKCLEEIYKNKKYSQLRENIRNYFNKYGGRFANELKLETEDFDTNPEYIIKLLHSYTNSNNKKNHTEISNLNLPINFSFSQKIKMKYFLKKIKHYTRRREELRLLRSQSFSLARKLFTQIGKKFQEQGILENCRDIFYLEVDEIKRFIEGSNTTSNLKEFVVLRKKQYAEFVKKELEDVFITEGDPYTFLSTKPIKSGKKEKHLSGKGCSYGIVKGKIKILNSFKLPEAEDYEIIVTKHTDPGWTPLFGLCKGMIVEHGGLLSHAAIISRELNLPCIIGVKGATKNLKDNQIVTINGSTGEIKIHE